MQPSTPVVLQELKAEGISLFYGSPLGSMCWCTNAMMHAAESLKHMQRSCHGEIGPLPAVSTEHLVHRGMKAIGV